MHSLIELKKTPTGQTGHLCCTRRSHMQHWLPHGGRHTPRATPNPSKLCTTTRSSARLLRLRTSKTNPGSGVRYCSVAAPAVSWRHTKPTVQSFLPPKHACPTQRPAANRKLARRSPGQQQLSLHALNFRSLGDRERKSRHGPGQKGSQAQKKPPLAGLKLHLDLCLLAYGLLPRARSFFSHRFIHLFHRG